MNKIIADEVSENEKLMKSHTKAEELFGSSGIIMGEANSPKRLVNHSQRWGTPTSKQHQLARYGRAVLGTIALLRFVGAVAVTESLN